MGENVKPTVEQLAQAMIGMLDAQRQYFKSRASADLIASKKLESAIRQTCMNIIQENYAPTDPD